MRKILLLCVSIMLLASSCSNKNSNKNSNENINIDRERQIEFVKSSFCPFYNGRTTNEELAAHIACMYGTVTWEAFLPILEDGKTHSHIVCVQANIDRNCGETSREVKIQFILNTSTKGVSAPNFQLDGVDANYMQMLGFIN